MAPEIRRPDVRKPTPTWTIDELRQHFGMIPANRILRVPKPGTATMRDLIRANEKEGHLCELLDGVLVEKAVGVHESRLTAFLIFLVHKYLARNPLGEVLAPDGFLEISPRKVRAPDISFLGIGRLPGGVLPVGKAYPELVPDLMIEVLSKSNTRKEIEQKLIDFFGAGTSLAWIIDLKKQTIRVHESAVDFRLLTLGDTLDGGSVLPGFSVTLERFFALDRSAG